VLASEQTRSKTEWPFAKAEPADQPPGSPVAAKTINFMFDLDLS
jgi:hypothetical protein